MPIPKELKKAIESGDSAAIEAAYQELVDYETSQANEARDAAVEEKDRVLAKNKELLAEKKDWSRKYDEKVRELLDQNPTGDAKALVALKETQFKKDLDEREKRIQELEKDLEIVVDSSLQAALAGKTASKTRMEDAMTRLRGSVKMIRDENGRPKVIAETPEGNFAVDEYVSNWLKTDIGKEYAAVPETLGDPRRNLDTKVQTPRPAKKNVDLRDPAAYDEYVEKYGRSAWKKEVEKQRAQRHKASEPVPASA